MTTMFETKGDTAEWQMVYDVLETMEIDDLISYDRLSEILGRDFLADRGPIYRATRELEIERKRTMANVVNEGYRMVNANEHEGLASHHHRKSRRQMRRSVQRASSADRNLLSADERKRIDQIELNASRQLSMIKRLDARQTVTEKVVRQTRQKVEKVEVDHDATAAQVAKLAAALERHGIPID